MVGIVCAFVFVVKVEFGKRLYLFWGWTVGKWGGRWTSRVRHVLASPGRENLISFV